MSDDLRTKLRRIADGIADAAELVEVAQVFVADMRAGCGEAPADAPPEVLPPTTQEQPKEAVPSTTKDSTPSSP